MNSTNFRLGVAMGFAAAVVAAGCATPAKADSGYLYGIHWWGYDPGQPIGDGPAILLDCPTYGGWDLETILTHGGDGWSASHFLPLYQELATNRNMSMVTRIDYQWGETVPSPTNPVSSDWRSNVLAVVNSLRQHCHIWIIGNEPNIVGEGNNWPDSHVTPDGYAAVYRSVRNYIHERALPSPLGPHIVLVAPASPGGVIAGVRWMAGDTWLSQVLDNIPADEIDGFGLHAYGGTVSGFHSSYTATLNMIDSRGFKDRPVYLTEWNRYSTPDNAAAEAAAAAFCRGALADINTWNQDITHHNIVGTMWFVYPAGGQWDGYSIEYWRTHGNPPGDPGDLFTAYQETVELRYHAGAMGVPNYPPTARFAAITSTSGIVPLTVTFQDQSRGAVRTWAWNFGDQQGSAAQHPTHTYTAPGTYTVSLTVTTLGGSDITTRVGYVTVTQPIAAFDGTPTRGAAPLEVSFRDFSQGSITSWQWDFGDQGTSAEKNPTHVYATPGRYTVGLTVTTNGGIDTETRADYVEVLFAEDFDADGDVDVSDFGFLQLCFNGPSRPFPFAGCDNADFDGDGDVDLSDFSRFLACFNGPSRPPAAGCSS